MSEGLASEPAGQRLKIILFAIAFALCAVAAVVFRFASLPLPPLNAFLPTFYSVVVFTDLITAYLILAHAPLSGRRSVLWLGGAYLFSGTIVLAQILVFPGVWSDRGLLGAGPQSAAWLWVMQHCGFPLFVMAAMTAEWRRRDSDDPDSIARPLTGREIGIMVAGVLGLVLFFQLLVTLGHDWLPEVITENRYAVPPRLGRGVNVIFLNGLALIIVVAVTRLRNVLDFGLAIAVLASLIDVLLTVRAGGRFTLGWYTARLGSVIPAMSVLAVYLREVTLLYARVSRLNAQLARQLALDFSTGLYNRRHFDRQLAIALAEARLRSEPMSLLLIDIDHFKLYNDHYGHLAGDESLRRFAEAIRRALLRSTDIASRYGGEEFAVILPGTDADGARHVAERVLVSVRHLGIEHSVSPTAPTLTASVGVATAGRDDSFEAVIRRADHALYIAKNAGRNRIA